MAFSMFSYGQPQTTPTNTTKGVAQCTTSEKGKQLSFQPKVPGRGGVGWSSLMTVDDLLLCDLEIRLVGFFKEGLVAQ